MDLKLLKREIETDGSPVRLTKTKCAILGQYKDEKYGECLEFIRKRDGKIEVKWRGHVKVETFEVRECDMGHQHKIVKDDHWVWNYCVLEKRDIERLMEFLV